MSAAPQIHEPITTPKQCRTCEEIKSPGEFYPNWRLTDGVNSQCKECDKKESMKWAQRNPAKAAYHKKNTNLKVKYGITADDFNAMLKKQHGKCASCDDPLVPGFGTHVDHDHSKTGRESVRDLLCDGCNNALGDLKESIKRAKSLIAYMHKWGIA